jgi:hypothetical protein
MAHPCCSLDDRHDVPGRPCRDQEMDVVLTASPYAKAVLLEKIDDVGACKLGHGITFPSVTMDFIDEMIEL